MLKQTFYRLCLKFRQFVSGATDLEIDFRKLVYDIYDNGFKLACTNEIAVNEKGDDDEEGSRSD